MAQRAANGTRAIRVDYDPREVFGARQFGDQINVELDAAYALNLAKSKVQYTAAVGTTLYSRPFGTPRFLSDLELSQPATIRLLHLQDPLLNISSLF